MRNIQRIPVSSTSHAAELASKELGAGAICSLVCADIYGLKVLDRDIEDIQGKKLLPTYIYYIYYKSINIQK